MAWFALVDIDGYKVGDVLPDERGEVWAQMYKVPHVEFRKTGPQTPVFVPTSVVKETLFEKKPDTATKKPRK
jgi:hypothetical protein